MAIMWEIGNDFEETEAAANKAKNIFQMFGINRY